MAVSNTNEYIENHPKNSAVLTILADILIESGLEESIKWGVPVYIYEGRNLIGIAAFKSYTGLWFYQGVFLSDPAGVLINAGEGKTKALRQWRFKTADEIDRKLVQAYIEEAIENQKAGKFIEADRNRSFDMPSELDYALQKDKSLAGAFHKLSFGKQKEYALYISEAKRTETRINRITKITTMILEGIGLNDQYRKQWSGGEY